jgi:hypothetical protein
MLRSLLVLVALTGVGKGAIFPDRMGPATTGTFERGKATSLKPPDAELYEEYGFQEAEQVEYSGPKGKFVVRGWKVHDSTGGLALFQLLRPSDARASDLAELAATTAGGLIAAFGNYVFEFEGRKPTRDELDSLLLQLKGVERSTLPTLTSHLPPQNMIQNSERYIVGPVSLARFAGPIPPSVAAFHLAAEGQLARYKASNGDFTLVIFEYPVPNMARERVDALGKIGGLIVKRAGPLVAAVLPGTDPSTPVDADAAERALAKVVYQPTLSRQEVGEGPVKGMANIVLTGFLFAGVMIAASVLAGIWLGGFKHLFKRLGWVKDHPEVTVLRIREK